MAADNADEQHKHVILFGKMNPTFANNKKDAILYSFIGVKLSP